MSNPIDPKPTTALLDSYTYHSPLPDGFDPNREEAGEGWCMGIDEAGRGPVLGPMVYAAAYCPISFKEELESLGFDDSKALSIATRDHLWSLFKVHPELCYTSNILSPQDICKDMLRRMPFNLNRQAEESTISLIRDALDRGINVTECFVDALGPAPQWQAKLSAIFPTISFIVIPKADSIYKIVGAASIIAKVSRDKIVENWIHPESPLLPLCLSDPPPIKGSGSKESKSKTKITKGKGRARVEDSEDGSTTAGTPRKKRKLTKGVNGSGSFVVDDEEDDVGEDGEDEVVEVVEKSEHRGSGYPSDPYTQSYLKAAFNPIFGYPSIVRFSWAGVKVVLEKDGVGCKWIDDPNANDRMRFFDISADNSKAKLWKDIGLSSVGEL